ncbi:MAG: transglutaminase domain-containing protein [Kiritimatiellae bacterium]|nr:transglutaminase domain-containing protein [Kiritimatiellia bacterium]
MSARTADAALPPAGLAAAALLFWGVLTGRLVLGAGLALLIEGRRVVRFRWETSEPLLARIWQSCIILFAVTVIVTLIRYGAARAGYEAFEWLAVVTSPIVLAQVYGTQTGIPVRVLTAVGFRRHAAVAAAGAGSRRVNLEYPYIATVLVAASAVKPGGPLFYAGVAALLGWAMLKNPARPRLNLAVTALAACVVAAAGYAGHIGLHNLHLAIEDRFVYGAGGRPDLGVDSSVTRIGTVGELKLSPAVAWRLREQHGRAPAYLRHASFNIWRRGMWMNIGALAFAPAQQGPGDRDDWRLSPPRPGAQAARLGLCGTGAGDPTYLPLPDTVLALCRLPAKSVARNGLAAVKVAGAPARLDFEVDYEAGLAGDTPPAKEDLDVPKLERAALQRVVERLDLAGAAPARALTRLSAFFAKHFRYSRYLAIDGLQDERAQSALQQFLEHDRRGHCEYFATATVLLLRQAGIPARYVTGYCVTEYDRRRQEYLIRGLHAHAWAQAWLDGAWHYVDTTPGNWLAVENEALPLLQPLRDWFQRVPFAIGRWRERPVGRAVTTAARWGALPLLLVYLWVRLFRGQRTRRVRARLPAALELRRPGMDSEWFRLEQDLVAALDARPRGEPVRVWWSRVGRRLSGALPAHVEQALTLHYRLRFDPGGLEPDDRRRLKTLADEARRALRLTR